MQLLFIYSSWCIQHHIPSRVVFRECYKVTDAFTSTKDSTQTVKAKSNTTMWWRAILKCPQQEAKLVQLLFLCHTQRFKHFLLQFTLVNTYRATPNFIAI